MNHTTVFRILGVLLLFFSVTMVPPLLISLLYQDGSHWGFMYGFAITLLCGLALSIIFNKARRDLRIRDGFLLSALFWFVLSCSGSIPIYYALDNIDYIDAIFESVSGFTTAGATVLTNLDSLPESINFYRAFLQWLGGIGIIVLAIAILPMLGIGGMQLYKVESHNPVDDKKLKPRITQTAKILWYIYLFLTCACALSYKIAGMTWFDAVTHSFTTVSIGGFSTHDDSMGFFNSQLIEIVAVVFMLISSLNFSLHYLTWSNRRLTHYLTDPEVKVLGLLMFGMFLVVVITLSMQGYAEDKIISDGIFHVISIGTTSGFTTTDINAWPLALPVLLIFFSCIGGCAGSTAGGIKTIRFILAFKKFYCELKKLAHPNAIFNLRLAGSRIPPRVIETIMGFLIAYVGIIIFYVLVLQMFGLDLRTSLGATISSINNLGASIGDVSNNYQSIPNGAKLLLAFLMVLGRLDLFTMLVLLSPKTWQN